MAMDGNIDSFQDATRATPQCSSDANKSSTGPTWAEQNSNDIKISNHGRMTEPFATVTTSVSEAGRAESMESGNSGFNTASFSGRDISGIHKSYAKNGSIQVIDVDDEDIRQVTCRSNAILNNC